MVARCGRRLLYWRTVMPGSGTSRSNNFLRKKYAIGLRVLNRWTENLAVTGGSRLLLMTMGRFEQRQNADPLLAEGAGKLIEQAEAEKADTAPRTTEV